MVNEDLIKNSVSDLIKVSPEKVIIKGKDATGKVRTQTSVYDNYIVTIYSNDDGSKLDLDLPNNQLERDYDDSQQDIIRAGAVWPCWFPGCAHCI